ncbi:MAG: protein-disulfide reductase DsbD family protein [Bacteroidales bacterium]
MKITKLKYLLFALFLTLSNISDAQNNIWHNKKLYEYKSFGDENLTIKMVSNFKSITVNDEFTVMVCFLVKDGWNTYSTKENPNYQALSLTFDLPTGLKMVEQQWSSPQISTSETGETKEIYTGEFYAKYTFKFMSDKFAGSSLQIKAQSSWQCCNTNLCLLGESSLELTLGIGKKVKSGVFKNIPDKL